jgi:hypothetical protein
VVNYKFVVMAFVYHTKKLNNSDQDYLLFFDVNLAEKKIYRFVQNLSADIKINV